MGLPLHTDGLYWTDPPGLQCFHALVPDATGGGRTLLLDGIAAAHALRASSPSSFAYLTTTTTSLPFHHTDSDSVYHARQRLISLNARGEVVGVWWNADDRAPFTGSPASSTAASASGAGASPAAADVLAFYSAIAPWRSTLQDRALCVELALGVGDLLVFDNTRVLHGRGPVSPTSGRVLAGCYHAREDWHSRLRVLARKLGG
jgi:alpha-ketoglutarate-dependent taurine dioxygenase